MLCVSLEFVKDELITNGLFDKAPSVKKNTCLFIEKFVQETYIDVLQKTSGDYLGALMKLSEDPDGEVRNSAL
jgi:hypothetical protein